MSPSSKRHVEPAQSNKELAVIVVVSFEVSHRHSYRFGLPEPRERSASFVEPLGAFGWADRRVFPDWPLQFAAFGINHGRKLPSMTLSRTQAGRDQSRPVPDPANARWRANLLSNDRGN